MKMSRLWLHKSVWMVKVGETCYLPCLSRLEKRTVLHRFDFAVLVSIHFSDGTDHLHHLASVFEKMARIHHD